MIATTQPRKAVQTMNKKLTYNEIIEALGRCGYHQECCFCNSVEECGSKKVLVENTLDFINRQQTENKRLEKEVNLVSIQFQDLQERYEEAQAEIERLNVLVKTKNKLIKGLDQSISYAYDRAIEEFANKVTHDINAYCENIRTKPSVDGVTGMKIANDLIYKRLNEMVNENDD